MVTLAIATILVVFLVARVQLLLSGTPLGYYQVQGQSTQTTLEAHQFKVGLFDSNSTSLVPVTRYVDSFAAF